MLLSRNKKIALITAAVIGLLLAGPTLASQDTVQPTAHNALIFLWIAIILFIAKISSFVERFGQPAVLGELIVGVILGNLALLGIHFFDPIKTSELLKFLAEIGVVILLFQVGLESNISEMRRVGGRALLVALIGVALPFIFGMFIVGPWLFPELGRSTHLFIGATLTATSVGISARVFKDLGLIHTPEAKIVLGASVIDDVLGLLMLAVVSGVVTAGFISPMSVAFTIFKALGFLVAALALGQILSRKLTHFIFKIQTGASAEFAIALSVGLFFAYLADVVGLSPIVGAFAAGLILDEVKMKFPAEAESANVAKPTGHKIEELIQPLGFFFVPIFFVITGMGVNLSALFNLKSLMITLLITAFAITGKIVAGLAAGTANNLVVGIGMVPRGEVGLIFAAIGQGLGIFSAELFSIIVLMIIITTFITPIALGAIYKKSSLILPSP